jgi:formate hydrogenlyase subunit 6/NADH:ubiquinone oxidoreductase subunit I
MKERLGKLAGTALRNLFRTPATLDHRNAIPDEENKIRGRLCFFPEKCVGCKLCMMDCPTGALKIENLGSKEDKKMRAVLDIGHCVFCCQCVDSCKRGCLHFSSDIKLAKMNKKDLTVEL